MLKLSYKTTSNGPVISKIFYIKKAYYYTLTKPKKYIVIGSKTNIGPKLVHDRENR